jgi:hypothetical protein
MTGETILREWVKKDWIRTVLDDFYLRPRSSGDPCCRSSYPAHTQYSFDLVRLWICTKKLIGHSILGIKLKAADLKAADCERTRFWHAKLLPTNQKISNPLASSRNADTIGRGPGGC